MRLDRFLAKTGQTQAAFAAANGFSIMSVSRWARGLQIPSPKHMATIRKATGGKVGPADFYPPKGDLDREAA